MVSTCCGVDCHTTGLVVARPVIVSDGGGSAIRACSSGCTASSRAFMAASWAAWAAAAGARAALRMAAGLLDAAAEALLAVVQPDPAGSTVYWPMTLALVSAAYLPRLTN